MGVGVGPPEYPVDGFETTVGAATTEELEPPTGVAPTVGTAVTLIVEPPATGADPAAGAVPAATAPLAPGVAVVLAPGLLFVGRGAPEGLNTASAKPSAKKLFPVPKFMVIRRADISAFEV